MTHTLPIKGSAGGMTRTARRYLGHENAVLVLVLIAVIVSLSIATKGVTSTPENMMNILLQSSIRGIAAIGQAFVILAGGIDISVGGIGLFCSILGAEMMTQTPTNIVGHPVAIGTGIAAMLAAGTGWGALNGLAVSRIGMPALIVTLAVWQVTTGFGFQISDGIPVTDLSPNLAFIGSGEVAGVPVAVIIFIAVFAIAYFVLNHTTFGHSIYATGGNVTSAWLSGIKVKDILFSVFAISGFLAGLSGVIMTSRTMSASMKSLLNLEMDSIAAATVGGISLSGGKGSLIGVLLGVLLIGVVNNGMSVLGEESGIQRILLGVIIFVAVAIDFLRRR